MLPNNNMVKKQTEIRLSRDGLPAHSKRYPWQALYLDFASYRSIRLGDSCIVSGMPSHHIWTALEGAGNLATVKYTHVDP